MVLRPRGDREGVYLVCFVLFIVGLCLVSLWVVCMDVGVFVTLFLFVCYCFVVSIVFHNFVEVSNQLFQETLGFCMPSLISSKLLQYRCPRYCPDL